MFLIFLGPPGCGKGTQSHFLVKDKNFCHLSTGDILRAEIESKSELGLQIDSTMKNGLYVEDDIILQIIKKKLEQQPKNSVLFDGFPRTVIQAEALDNLLSVKGNAIDAVIHFTIDDSILIQRIDGRFNCVNCGHVYHKTNKPPKVADVCDVCGSSNFARRDDDTEEKLKKRLEVYYQNTYPLIDFYKSKGVLVEIDSSNSLDLIRQQILSIVSRF